MKNITAILITIFFLQIISAENIDNKNVETEQFIRNFHTRETYLEYLKNTEQVYKNYINTTDFADTLIIETITETEAFGSEAKQNFLLFVNHELFDSDIDSALQIYKSDVESEGYAIKILTATNSRKVTEFRDFLEKEWNTNNISGAFLVGDLPVAYYEMASDFGEDTYVKFPTDLYFMDLDGEWYDRLENGESGVFDDHQGFRTIKPDIWIGRLYPSVLNAHNDPEKELVLRYFDKVHKYRIGDLRLKDQALNYIDKDWAGYNVEDIQKLAYKRMTTFKHGINTTCSRSDYRQKVQQLSDNKFEWMYHAVHSWHGGHMFTEGETFTSDWVDMINVQVLFYLNFNCSGALFTGEDCVCSWYVMQKPYGLLSVGSTKTGSMLSQRDYYDYVGQGYNIGNSFLHWGKLHFEDSRSWHYGMVILGDPTLRISRFMDKQGPDFCYAEKPLNGKQFDNKVPVFKWTSTDSAEYYILKILNNNGNPIITSPQLTDTTYSLTKSEYPSLSKSYRWQVKAYKSNDQLYDFTQKESFSIYYSDPDDLYLSNLQPAEYSQDWGELKFDKSTNGNTIQINGKNYYKGLGTHADSRIVYAIDSLSNIYDKFYSIIGHDDESDGENDDGVTFEIVLDSTSVFGPSRVFEKGAPAQEVEVDLNNADSLILLVHAGENEYNDHADWANAKLIKSTSPVFDSEDWLAQRRGFEIMNNYPNPFNPKTKINYKIFQEGYYRMDIYNLSGQKVTTLIDEYKTPGQYSAVWHTQNSGGLSLSSGIYFCKLQSKNKTDVLKMMLVR